jgi:DNA invertase Pin-like site-specific DNA recombinase
VLFINDNIDTRDGDGELRLSIMATLAQEESRKTSSRVKWGQKRRMESGVVFGNNSTYGFETKGGRLTVKPEEAEVVRLIYWTRGRGRMSLRASCMSRELRPRKRQRGSGQVR